MLGFAAPVDLKIEVISTTSVKVTAIPPKNSAAEFFEVAIEDPWMGYFDKFYFGKPPSSQVYTDLTPGQAYRFAYRLGARRLFDDIISETRTKLFTMPAVGKNYFPYNSEYDTSGRYVTSTHYFEIPKPH